MFLLYFCILLPTGLSPCSEPLMWPFLTPEAEGTHRGRGELCLRLHEQHALVHCAEGTEGLRRSRDAQVGAGGRKSLCWAEAQIHLWDTK